MTFSPGRFHTNPPGTLSRPENSRRDRVADLRKCTSETSLSKCRFDGSSNLNSKSFVRLPLGTASNGSDRPHAAMREPQGLGTAAGRSSWHHLTAAFLLGVIVAYGGLNLSVNSLLRAKHGIERRNSWGPEPAREVWDCGSAGPYPFAVGDETDDYKAPEKLIVAARHTDDTSWLDLYLSHIPHVVYQVDDPKNTFGIQHATLANKGNEAMAYLQFIIDYYDKLPSSIVFLHGHRGTWHLKDHVPILQRLRWGELPFANLRYANQPGDRLDWECGVNTELQEFKNFHCDWQGSHLQPYMQPRKAAVLNAGNKDVWWDSVELKEVWPEVFEAELGELPSDLKAPCCAEFMVSRDRVLAHSRDFYTHLRDWIVDTELGRYRSGRVFEYMWHIIFGEPHMIDAVSECQLLHCDNSPTS